MGGGASACLCRASPDKPPKTTAEKQQDETAALITPETETKCVVDPAETPADGGRLDPRPVGRLDPRPVGRPLLDYAQKMSQDIVAQALQLCWEVQLRYRDFPFIDSDCDYVI